MKHLYVFLSFSFIITVTQAQIVNIPDANLKNALVNIGCFNTSGNVSINGNGINFYNANFYVDVDANDDGEIQVAEALSVTNLNLINYSIVDLTGIEAFENLEFIDISGNLISDLTPLYNLSIKGLNCRSNSFGSTINLSQNQELEGFYYRQSGMTTIDISQNLQLKYLNIDKNPIGIVDLSQNINLIGLSCSDNNLTSLDVSQNILLEDLYCFFNFLTEIDVTNNLNLKNFWYSADPSKSEVQQADISQNVLLESLHCHQINMTNLDVSHLPNLQDLGCANCQLTSLDVTQNPNLDKLNCFNNQISNIDISLNPLLSNINISENLFTNIDLSQNPNLFSLRLNDSYYLEYVNLKNGNNQNLPSGNFKANNCPNLEVICVDDVDYAVANFTNVDPLTTFAEDCNITTVDYNHVQGTLSYDGNNNGCDVSDDNLSGFLIKSTDGVNEFGTLSNNNGFYSLSLVENTYTTSIVGLPIYFTSTPESEMGTFVGFNNTEIADFCITANQTVNDVNIVLIPTIQARPGFDATYQLIYENFGTTTLNGSVTLVFDDAMQTFLSAVPSENASTVNSLTFNYANLLPFQSGAIDIIMNTFTPPTVNDGDILNFTVSITPVAGDLTPNDNVYNLEQTVVNSLDPNDKQVLQGTEIYIDEADEYLDYIIRFQNTGTASAINVAITDQLNNKLDWNTLSLISSSHNYIAKITNESLVEFIFDGINLPAEQDDEPGSHGFVAFKIKPKSDVMVGDIIWGEANIYFDFNAPITTNQVSTEIVNTLSVNENELETNLLIYPNPSTTQFSIKTSSSIIIDKVELYSLTGKRLFITTDITGSYNISKYTSGIYFVRVTSSKGIANKRLIKN